MWAAARSSGTSTRARASPWLLTALSASASYVVSRTLSRERPSRCRRSSRTRTSSGRDGARLVVVEADEGVAGVSCFRDWGATLLAFRIARELAEPDPFTSLALEGLALELTAAAARGPSTPHPAPWAWSKGGSGLASPGNAFNPCAAAIKRQALRRRLSYGGRSCRPSTKQRRACLTGCLREQNATPPGLQRLLV